MPPRSSCRARSTGWLIADPLLLSLYLGAVNLAAFGAFGLDKGRARRSEWRIGERTLLGLAAIGGTPGAWLGRACFRHKTRKASFSLSLALISALQIGLFIWFIMRP
jgi:uncharacterized membrane protein YsdA (DUF1294 family)